jgi:hypothetical protein
MTTANGLTRDTLRTVRFELRNLLATRQSCCALAIHPRYERATLGRLVALGGPTKDFVLASFAGAADLWPAVASGGSR